MGSEWIAGETPRLHSRWFAAASAPSLLDTSLHLGRQQLPLCYRLHPETPHTTFRRLVPRGPRLLLCPSAELLRPAEVVASYRPNTPFLSLACCSGALATARLSLPPSRSPALISPIDPSQVRLVAAACCFVSIYRGRLFPTGLSLEERGGGLVEVFEISYRSKQGRETARMWMALDER